MDPALAQLLGWALFAGTHVGLASVRVRPRLVARLGERGYLALYSLVALATFVPLVLHYGAHRHEGPWLFPPLRAGAGLALVHAANAAALVFVVGSFVQPSPAALGRGGAPVHGIVRVTRHPLFVGIALWALAHAAANASTVDLAFFGGMAVFAIAGAIHQDRRKLALGTPGYAELVRRTSLVPFAAPGAARGLREIPAAVWIAALAAAVALRLAHPWLFG